MLNTYAEENHLKTLFHLSDANKGLVGTNELAKALGSKASTITEMSKRLAEKGLLIYRPYKGAELSDEGRRVAINVIRKHRLWEVFLVEKLGFQWDEVHEIAEQLEHINSPNLINKLDSFLGHPRRDPHGEPIPEPNGEFVRAKLTKAITEMNIRERGRISHISDVSPELLRYFAEIGIKPGVELELLQIFSYDGSMLLLVNNEREAVLSVQMCELIKV